MATFASLTATGTAIQWYDAATAGTLLANSTSLVDGTTYYASQTVSTCESTSRLAVTVQKISESTQTFCDGATVAGLVSTPSAGETAAWFTTSEGGTALVSTDTLATATYYAEETTPESTITLAGGFNGPVGVAVQSDGKILGVDYGNSAIKRMDADGSNIVTLGSGFNYPIGVAVQVDGKILVADYGNSVIKRMNADGSNIVVLGSGFNHPSGVTVQADGKILVVDTYNNAIKKMNADGTDIVTLASEFLYPFGVAVQADGKILVADKSNNSIKRMEADGTGIVTLGSGFNQPFGVSVQVDGKILVADYFNNAIKRMDADGSNIVTLGNGFNLPTSVVVQADGEILVADYDNNSIKRITQANVTNRVAVAVTTTPSSDNVTTVSACDSYLWNGTTYTTSGIKTGTTTNCVTEKLDLTVTPSSIHITTVSACDNYLWNGTTYTTSGIKTGTTTNCVTEKLDLTITASPIAPVSIITLLDNSIVLNADQAGASYQWMDCNNDNTPILGEINQNFTPTIVGSYSVMVTLGTCSVTSDCVVVPSLKTDSFDLNSFNFYPNPIKDFLNLNYSKEITSVKVFNVIGQTLLEKLVNAKTAQINMTSFPSGMYFVEVKSLDSYKTIKVIKK